MKPMRLKRLLKYLWARMWFDSGLLSLLALVRGRFSGGPPVAILMYHRVVPPEQAGQVLSHPDIVVDAADFRRQLEFLRGHCRVLSLADYVSACQACSPLPGGTVVLTFDDGWQDNYHTAFPLLGEFAMPSTVFVSTGFIDTRKLFWQEQIVGYVRQQGPSSPFLRDCFTRSGLSGLLPLLDPALQPGGEAQGTAALIEALMASDERAVAGLLDRLSAAGPLADEVVAANTLLSWTQVAEMSRQGVVFGSHGVNHRRLDRISPAAAEEEIHDSREVLQERLPGKKTDLFAYPNGDFFPETVELLRQAGYRAAVTTREGLNLAGADPFRLKRINVCQRRFQSPAGRFSPALFAAYLAGLL